jgi:hypothetical protein
MGAYDSKTGKLVAWAFIAMDGSLASLHVEEPYRGLGLAKAITVSLFRAHLSKFGSPGDNDGNGLAHADVALGNVSSHAVCKSLGGRAAWVVYW